MAARQEVTFIITARDRTRAVFRRIRGGLRRMRAGLLSLVGAAGFGALIKDTLNFSSAIENAEKRLDIAGDKLEALRIIAKNNGVEFANLLTIIQRMSRRAGEATTGITPRLIEDFERLGVAFDVLKRGDPEEILLAVAEGAKEFTGTIGELQATLQKVGDIESVAAVGLFRQGREGILREINRLQREGKILGEERREDAAQAEQVAREELGKLATELRGLVAELVPVLRDLTPVLRDWAIVANRLVAEGVPGAVEQAGFPQSAEALRLLGDLQEGGIGGVTRDIGRDVLGIDPEVRAALLKTAVATEETARKIEQSGSFTYR